MLMMLSGTRAVSGGSAGAAFPVASWARTGAETARAATAIHAVPSITYGRIEPGFTFIVSARWVVGIRLSGAALLPDPHAMTTARADAACGTAKTAIRCRGSAYHGAITAFIRKTATAHAGQMG